MTMHRKLALTLITLAVALGIALPVFAAPFLITDAIDPNADQCVYQVGSGAPQVFPPVTENGQRLCKIDLASAPSGPSSITVRVRNSLWGVESAAAPFAFTKPTSLAAPANTRLVP
jgi:hypothetical protein